ncbi:MAG: hypothetical protein R3344_14385 [Acidobacteriota bacterium]|nr:hypothetical protein [Acidobacteriota bacterium]
MKKRPKSTSRRSKPVVDLAEPGVAYEAPLFSLQRLIEILGNNRTAELLGVARSQPSRWARGLERMGPENQRRVLDLEYALSCLLLVYPPRQARIWLESHNIDLGARPIDVLRITGVEPVLRAIDIEAQGAYA